MQPDTAPSIEQLELTTALQDIRTETDISLLDLVDQAPVLLIFLRHFGCSFCRQTLDQVSHLREQIAARGVNLVFVHLGSPERAKPYFDYYHLSDVQRVSSPDGSLYQNAIFHLSRTNPFSHFFMPVVWKGWLQGALRKYGIGMIHEDGHQMPGVFMLRDRRIWRVFRYRSIADEPDWLKLIG